MNPTSNPTSIRIGSALMADIDDIASKTRRSRSQTIQLLLEDALNWSDFKKTVAPVLDQFGVKYKDAFEHCLSSPDGAPSVDCVIGGALWDEVKENGELCDQLVHVARTNPHICWDRTEWGDEGED